LVQSLLRWFKKVENLILLGIIGLSAYFYLTKITHLFYWMKDYDEGAYSLGGRFISEGYLPYKDFVLVHPPLYDLVLALLYKIVGYNFFYGRIFSVFLLVACEIIAYLTVKKLVNSTAACIAALSFAFFPGLTLLWFRVVQEPLGILCALLSVFFAADFILHRQKIGKLFFSGIFLGLLVATKYTFIPFVAGFVIALWAISKEGRWLSLRSWFSAVINKQTFFVFSGLLSGYYLVCGYFIIRTPQEFFTQTFLSQIGYRTGGILDSVWIRFFRFTRGSWEDTITTLCILLILLVVVLLVIKKKSIVNRFVCICLIVSFCLCSFFNAFGEMRYMISAYIFMLFGIVAFVPALNYKLIKSHMTPAILKINFGLIGGILLIILFLAGTSAIRYELYVFRPFGTTFEELTYKNAADYVDKIGAKKVYFLNPMIPALYPDVPTTHEFDTFGLLYPLRQSPQKIIQDKIDEGVDYIVLDSWVWSFGFTEYTLGELVREIDTKYPLVDKSVPGYFTFYSVKVYSLQK
jgi:hypothetical protein